MASVPSRVISEAIDNEAESLQEVSRRIWAKPELAYEETTAHDVLTDYLDKAGFDVQRQYKLSTAFRATYSQGHGGAHVVVICEYDALPVIGHACGHNLIAEAGVAAGLGLKAVMQQNGSVSGRVTILGTPAEESGGGKIDLINAGVFEGVDIALMAHPDQENMMTPLVLAYNTCTVTFTGLAAHAAAAPWDGVNALDAAVSAYASISMLRQQLQPDRRIHAIIAEGGVRPNIIPEKTVVKYMIRAPYDKQLATVKQKATDIMASAATSTGCTADIQYASPDRPAHYSNMVSNTDLAQRFQSHWESFQPADPVITPSDHVWASTDMGNVSYVVPSIHPTFSIGTASNIHTRTFAEAAMSQEAHAATRCAAKGLACVGWDVMSDGAFLSQVKETFKLQLASL